MPHVVYILCAFTSLICAILLIRGYLATRTRLLFWGGLCFVFLTATNVLLFADLVVFPSTDLLFWRQGTALAGVMVFLYGLVSESK